MEHVVPVEWQKHCKMNSYKAAETRRPDEPISPFWQSFTEVLLYLNQAIEPDNCQTIEPGSVRNSSPKIQSSP